MDNNSNIDNNEIIRIYPVITTIHSSCYCGLSSLNILELSRELYNIEYKVDVGTLIQLSLINPKATINIYNSGKIIIIGPNTINNSIIAARRACRYIQLSIEKLNNRVNNSVININLIKFLNFRVHNIAASGSLGYKVNLNLLNNSELHSEYCDYNPDQFPGIIYKLPVYFLSEAGTIKYYQNKSDKIKKEQQQKKQTQNDFIYNTLFNTNTINNNSVNVIDDNNIRTNSIVNNDKSDEYDIVCRIFANGRITLTGAKKEEEILAAFNVLSSMLFPFAIFDNNKYNDYDNWLQTTHTIKQQYPQNNQLTLTNQYSINQHNIKPTIHKQSQVTSIRIDNNTNNIDESVDWE